MNDLEDKIRAALRQHAERLDDVEPDVPRAAPWRWLLHRGLSILVAFAFVGGAIGAALWIEGDEDPVASTTVGPVPTPTPTPTPTVEPTATQEACSPPPFTVSRLPWLPAGAEVPAPDEHVSDDPGGPESVLVWFEDPLDRVGDPPSGQYVALGRSSTPLIGSFEGFPTAPVRGRTGHLVWIGDPGVGPLALVWTEGEEACSWYSLHMSSQGMSERDAEQELVTVAASLS